MDARRIFLIVSSIGLIFVLAHALAWMAPDLAGFTREMRDRVETAADMAEDETGRAGLIYVESPEVYTRQRLVNDRYLQDAWLRSKLAEIDNDDAIWIDEIQNEMRRAIVDIAAAAPGTSTPDAAAETPQVTLSEADRAQLAALPFETRFQLQSEARDKIRQLVLENALDDRHDLSGNTVFGLKFDTSVLPGSATRLNPTVVVRMQQNPLDKLLNQTDDTPESFVRHFMAYSNATEGAGESETGSRGFPPAQKAILQDVDRHYYDWLQNVERRILEEVPPRGTLCKDQPLDIDQVTQMCDPGRLFTAPQRVLRGDARSVVDMLAQRADQLDEAIGYVTRAVGVTPRIAYEKVDGILETAELECEDPWIVEGALSLKTFRDFLEDESTRQTRTYTDGPWGQFFFVQTGLKLFDNPAVDGEQVCDANLEITLVEPEMEFYVTNSNEATSPLLGTLFPLECSVEVCGSDIVWVRWPDSLGPDARLRIQSRLNDAFFGAVLDIARTEGFQQAICIEDFGAFGTIISAEQKSEVEDDAENCSDGFYFSLRWGAFEFFRKMAEVESYTYTAFPRGDVSGVVTSSGSTAQVGARGAAGLFSGGAAFSRSQAQRSVEATPEVINFASGESRSREANGSMREPFDFAWTVVKPGLKDPMMVSQLVLVSVPAYLDEIELEIWKGFMDVDRVPVDRTEELEALGGKSFNDASLDKRLDHLMEGLEKREITIRVPPDYAALDSIVIGRSAILGPVINERTMKNICPFIVRRTSDTQGESFHFDLLIPGERLWRSSVVTLGGMKASAIEVMPNMRGLRATFETPQRPDGTYDLRVWTSEGASDAVDISFSDC